MKVFQSHLLPTIAAIGTLLLLVNAQNDTNDGFDTESFCASVDSKGYLSASQYVECETMNRSQIVQALNVAEFELYHNITYGDSQNVSAAERQEQLKDVAQVIADLNTLPQDFNISLNKYSTWTTAELKARNGFQHNPNITFEDNTTTTTAPATTDATDPPLPDAVDWNAAGAVTHVKDQGSCACCWAITTAATIEGIAAIDTNFEFVESLSFQQFISCSTQNNGCSGGSNTAGLQYGIAAGGTNPVGGLVAEAVYPYTDYGGTTTPTCLATPEELAVTASGALVPLTMKDPIMSFDDRVLKMKQAVARQPVAIALNAVCPLINHYHEGVLTLDTGCACSAENITRCVDHAVTLIGYNDTAPIPYWLIKNSWGTDWGEQGFFRVAQQGGGAYGLFGMLSEAAVPASGVNVTDVFYAEPTTGADDSGSGTMSIFTTTHAITTIMTIAMTIGIVATWLS